MGEKQRYFKSTVNKRETHRWVKAVLRVEAGLSATRGRCACQHGSFSRTEWPLSLEIQLCSRPASTALCTTSFTPPLASAPKFQIRYAHPTSLGCHQLHMVIVVKLQEPSRSAFLRSVMIFVKYREVSTRTTLPNLIGNCRDSIVFAFWWRHGQKRERGSICQGSARQESSELLQFNSPSQPGQFPWPTRIILQGNQNSPCVQP